MNFYGVRELSNNTKTVLSTVRQNGTAVITDNGKPTAIMIGITEESFESIFALLQQMKAKCAFEELQRQAQKNFPRE